MGRGLSILPNRDSPYPDIYWTPAAQNRNLFNIFAQDTWAIVPDRLHLTVGSKLEHNDFDGFQLEPSGRLLWTPDDRNSIWGAVSRETRSPATVNTALNLNSSVSEVPVGGGVSLPLEEILRGNPHYISEKEVSYELGYRCQVTKSFSADARCYYNNETHAEDAVIGAVQPGNPLVVPITFNNGGQEDSYGGEISGNLRVNETGGYRHPTRCCITPLNWRRLKGDRVPSDHAQSAPQHQVQLHSYLDITKTFNSTRQSISQALSGSSMCPRSGQRI